MGAPGVCCSPAPADAFIQTIYLCLTKPAHAPSHAHMSSIMPANILPSFLALLHCSWRTSWTISSSAGPSCCALPSSSSSRPLLLGGCLAVTGWTDCMTRRLGCCAGGSAMNEYSAFFVAAAACWHDEQVGALCRRECMWRGSLHSASGVPCL